MKYFTPAELIHSNIAARKAIDNTPSKEHYSNLENLINLALDPLREELGKAIIVSSGYRCPLLNVVVKGAKTSQHMEGLAADIVCHRVSVEELWRLAKDMSEKGYILGDQVILEYNQWVHLSSSPTPRGEYFRIG